MISSLRISINEGLLLDDLGDEIIDHVCSAVEEKINNGERFIDSYNEVIQSFGSTDGIQQTQKETATTIMFKSYLLVALRNHLRQRFYTIINIGGLAIGVASCLIIGLFVLNELSYDREFPNVDRLYRVDTEIKFGPNHFILASTTPGFASALGTDTPDIEAWVRVRRAGSRFLQATDGREVAKVENVFRADSSLFKVLQIPIIEGNGINALKDINSVVISRSLAEKYFGSANVVGQSIRFTDDPQDYKVAVVFEDLPANSHIHPELFLSMLGSKESFSTSLVGGGDATTYVLDPPRYK
ncbi:MAG: ABC transporter permease [Bacteroidota bacterium]